MRFVFGIICLFLTLGMFYLAVIEAVPNYDIGAIGYDIGKHAAWMIMGLITFYLLRGKKN